MKVKKNNKYNKCDTKLLLIALQILKCKVQNKKF